jgi:transcriptional regulator with XRE-family HTH domain
MSRGYSLRIRDLNAKADKRKLGVRLGRLCIKKDVPVMVVAKRMGVTRATVYNWFCGASAPQYSLTTPIETYIAELESAAG